MKLKDLAEIRTGYPFRRKIITRPNGEIPVIQMKNVNDSGIVDCSMLDRIDTVHKDPIDGIDIKNPNYFLKPGDILFKSKGSKNNAGVLIKEIGPAVASQQFLIIKVNEQENKPLFIAWYLNYLNGTGYFKKENEGTYIPFISKQTISELEIPILPIEIQKIIINYNKLVLEEAILLEKIKDKRQKQMQAVMSKNMTKYK